MTDYRRDHTAAAVRARLAGLDEWRAETARAMKEDSALLPRVLKLVRELQIPLVYHTHRSDRSQPGYPDLHIVGLGGDLYRELKRETGAVTDAQQEWLERLAALGHDTGVWRPSDLMSGRIAEELAAIRTAQTPALTGTGET